MDELVPPLRRLMLLLRLEPVRPSVAPLVFMLLERSLTSCWAALEFELFCLRWGGPAEPFDVPSPFPLLPLLDAFCLSLPSLLVYPLALADCFWLAVGTWSVLRLFEWWFEAVIALLGDWLAMAAFAWACYAVVLRGLPPVWRTLLFLALLISDRIVRLSSSAVSAARQPTKLLCCLLFDEAAAPEGNFFWGCSVSSAFCRVTISRLGQSVSSGLSSLGVNWCTGCYG